MNTYVEQLKGKYKDPSKAYKNYILSQQLIHHFVANDDAPEDVKEIAQFQDKINSFSYDLIDNNVELHTYFGFSTKEELINFTSTDQNLDFFNFLEIKYELKDKILNGKYQLELDSQSKNINWDELEILINKNNNNNIKIGNPHDIKKTLYDIVKEFSLQSITLGDIKVEDGIFSQISDGLGQIALALDCNKKQIGLNKLNFCCNTSNEINLYSAYLDRFKTKYLKLYINSSVIESSLAHEWLHFADLVAAEHKYYKIYGEEIYQGWLYESNMDKNIFVDMIDASFLNNLVVLPIDIEDKIFNNIENIIKKYSLLNVIKDEEKLHQYIQKIFDERSFEKNNIIKELKKYEKHGRSGFIPYIIAEINTLKYDNTKDDLSRFIKYASKMDEVCVDIGLLDKGDKYSLLESEILARIFETYVDIKLKEKNINNTISCPSVDFYCPQKEEIKHYISECEKSINKLKIIINDICPINDILKIREKFISQSNKNNVNRRL